MSKAENQIHLLVRSVIQREGSILLLRPSASNSEFSNALSFLPGGHVEHGEPVQSGLQRELKEELGLDFTIGDTLGALECTWKRKGSLYHELNLVMLADHPSLRLDTTPLSKEGHIEFFWHPIDQLHSVSLLPKKLAKAIPLWIEKKGPLLFSEMEFR